MFRACLAGYPRTLSLPRSTYHAGYPLHPDYLRCRYDRRYASPLPLARVAVTSTNVVLAVAYHGIQARDLGGNLVDLGCTPCDGEYQVFARVSPDGSAELHVLTHGHAAPCYETEYGTYEDARTLALCAYNILHD